MDLFPFLLQLELEILHSELLKDFVPAGVALKIDPTIRTGDHLEEKTLHQEEKLTFGGKLLGTTSHLEGPYPRLSDNIAFANFDG